MPDRVTIHDVIETLRAFFAGELPGCFPDELRASYMDRSGRRRWLIHPVLDEKPSGAKDGLPPRRHSCDYRSAHWDGSDYTFTPTQAKIVKVLWEALEQGTPCVGQESLLEAADSEARNLAELFRECGAWGSMIVQGPNRTYRLAA